ncbi:MAG: response regulator [Gemmatimonadales bacterium]|nr:response regulator [Gemmatimonadales bacterium]
MTLTDPRLAYGSLPVLIWTAGADGSCDYLNERWSEFTGRPASDMLGWKWLDRVHPDDKERVLVEYTGAVAGRRPVRLEFRLLHHDGDYRWVFGTGEPCYRAGEFLGYSGCTTDVTDRRALEQRLAHIGRTGEIAQLAGGIAHDFNNLLTGILGHVTLLLDERSLSAEAREDLAQIGQAADRAAALSRHLLAFSRRPHPAPRSLDLNQIVSGTMSAIRQIVGTAVEVRYELEESLEPVLADPGQLEQVLIQLGAHGRAAMPGGGRLSLRTGRAQVDEADTADRPGLRPGSYITLEVGHTGPGLGSEALARMFDPPGGGAAGDRDVDLSPVAGIARQTGGHVEVASAPGGGITFTLYIPRLPGPLDAPAGVEAAATEGTGTILLAEDDPQVLDVGRRALERAGYTVLTASNAEAAIAVADRHPGHIHLLVTDVLLPSVSGRELAARLAIHRPATKVLYVSGTSDDAIARHRMLEPGIEFLEKPFSLDCLLRKVRGVLGVDLSAEGATLWMPRSLV